MARHRRCRRLWTFPPNAATLRTLRRQLGEQLRVWEICDDDIQNATLVAGELASNAIRHAATPYELAADLRGATLSISVADLNSDCPEPRPPDHTGGRGLALISALTQGWRCLPKAPGKIVIAKMALIQPRLVPH
jgi:anti-sigma regulatory factor (Ser/Thr protein kinase)